MLLYRIRGRMFSRSIEKPVFGDEPPSRYLTIHGASPYFNHNFNMLLKFKFVLLQGSKCQLGQVVWDWRSCLKNSFVRLVLLLADGNTDLFASCAYARKCNITIVSNRWMHGERFATYTTPFTSAAAIVGSDDFENALVLRDGPALWTDAYIV